MSCGPLFVYSFRPSNTEISSKLDMLDDAERVWFHCILTWCWESLVSLYTH